MKKDMFGYKVNIVKHRDSYNASRKQFGSWSARSHHVIDSIIFKEVEYPDVVQATLKTC